MPSDEKLHLREFRPWTLGELRDATEALPDDLPIRVRTASRGDAKGEQVVIGVVIETGPADQTRESATESEPLNIRAPVQPVVARWRRLRWAKAYAQQTLKDWKWVLWLLAGFVTIVGWSADFPPILTLALVMSYIALALPMTLIMVFPFQRLARFDENRATLAVICFLALAYLSVIVSVVVLGYFSSILGAWLTHHLRSPDDGSLLGCLLSFFFSIFYMILRQVLVWNLASRDDEARKTILKRRLHLYTEAAWLYGLIGVALVPAALRASVVPNLLCCIVVPVVVLYMREHYRLFLSRMLPAGRGVTEPLI